MTATDDSQILTTAPDRTWRPSAGILTGGLAALAVGYVVGQLGLYLWLGAGRGSRYLLDGRGSGLVFGLGVLIGLAGFAATLVGVWRLAHNADAATAPRDGR